MVYVDVDQVRKKNTVGGKKIICYFHPHSQPLQMYAQF